MAYIGHKLYKTSLSRVLEYKVYHIFYTFRESEKRQKKKLLLDYLYANLKNHNFWAYRYFFCEFLGILNVVGKFINKCMLALSLIGSTILIFPDCHRSNVSDGQIFWWNFFNIWYRSDLVCWEGPRGQNRPNGNLLKRYF